MIVYPVINLDATGERIKMLRKMKGMSVAELQEYFGFEHPNAIYKWQKGDSLPTVDNLLALSVLFKVSMNEILVYEEDQDFLLVNDVQPQILNDWFKVLNQRFMENEYILLYN